MGGNVFYTGSKLRYTINHALRYVGLVYNSLIMAMLIVPKGKTSFSSWGSVDIISENVELKIKDKSS